MPRASNLDRQMWAEFQTNRNTLAPVSEEAVRSLFGAKGGDELDLVKGVGVRVRKAPVAPAGPTELPAQVTVGRGQQFFRQMILNAFDSQCVMTGIRVRDLLVASHILPWKEFEKERLNPQNGLCLSRLHDGAFDRGLITFDEAYRLVVSRELKRDLPQKTLTHTFMNFEGERLLRQRLAAPPKQEFLAYHREKIFRG